MRRPVRIAVVAAGTILAVACGLDIAGSGPQPTPGDDGGREGGAVLPESGSNDSASEGSVVDLDGGSDVVDAGDPDAARQLCLSSCDAGACDGGVCVVDCNGASACGARVVCPAGVPCDVRCSGASACAAGVDCTAASACNIVCTGTSACANDTVECGGASCTVKCGGAGSGNASACAAGILCDAGRCDLGCAGPSACANGPVGCNANVCNVQCGTGADDSRQACASGVQCTGVQRCAVDCRSRETCTNGDVVALAADASTVRCVRDSCRSNIIVSASDAGIECTGSNACINNSIYCDGGKCTASCNGSNPTFCCKSPTSCNEVTAGGCSFGNGGCP